jgi:hypothetical protein
MRLSPAILLAALAHVALCAQLPPTAVEQVIDNYAELTGTIQMNRTVYFIGEEATLTITVLNPTASALLIAKPFHSATGTVRLHKQSADGTWDPMSPDEGQLKIDETTPTVTLNAGAQQQITISSHTSTPEFGDSGLPFPAGSTPSQPGNYKVTYTIGASSAQLQVVEPLFEVASRATLHEPEEYVENGVQETLPRYIYAFAARWNGVSYICLGQPTTHTGTIHLQPGQPVTRGDIPASRIKRVFSSPTPVSQLQVSEDGQGSFTIIYTLANNQQGTILLNANREPI